MTKVTALETAVIVNIVALGSSSVNVQDIPNGPEAVKLAQVNAVLLNLKGKGLVARDEATVSLTADGVAVHAELFPAQKDLDVLRLASNIELNQQAPVSEEAQALIAALVAIRKSAKRLGKAVTALEDAVKVKADAEVDLPMAHIEPADLTGLPVQVLA